MLKQVAVAPGTGWMGHKDLYVILLLNGIDLTKPQWLPHSSSLFIAGTLACHAALPPGKAELSDIAGRKNYLISQHLSEEALGSLVLSLYACLKCSLMN